MNTQFSYSLLFYNPTSIDESIRCKYNMFIASWDKEEL